MKLSETLSLINTFNKYLKKFVLIPPLYGFLSFVLRDEAKGELGRGGG